MKIYYLKYLTLIFLWFAISDCSVKRNRWINRQYHMLNTQYNVLFNGEQLLIEAENLINKNFIPNYNDILPLFKDEDKNAKSTALSTLEESIEKGLKAISLHSITRKPRRKKGAKSEKYKEFRRKIEYNNLIDECYLLIGKAKYYKEEYDQAEQIFKYLKRNYKDNKILYETELWNTRTAIKKEKYILAEKLLEDLLENPNFPKKLNNFALKIRADIDIKSNKYEEATKSLKNLIDDEKKVSQKARYYFILAQVYEKLDLNEKAINYYQKLIKLDPEYELQFKANLNIIHLKNYDDTDDILEKLEEMLVYKRNSKYKDQIYYIIAELYAKIDDIKNAKKNYLNTIENFIDNENQRALAYLKLGNYAYDEKSYDTTKIYYDKAFPYLASDLPAIDTINTRLQLINELHFYQNTIKHEEDIQRVAKLSTEEQINWAKRIQSESLKDYDEEKKTATIKISKPTDKSKNRTQKQTQNQTWYFYNSELKNHGQAVFEKKWGKRKLEDNWRRSSKTTINKASSSQFTQLATAISPQTISQKKVRSIEEILSILPISEEQVTASNKRILQAYYHIGLLYELSFSDVPKAIETYKSILHNFLDNPANAQALFQLHNIYLKTQMLDLATEYKERIFKEYPNSIQANYLENPENITQFVVDRDKVSELYSQSYKHFAQDEFKEMMNTCTYALNNYPKTSLKSNFLFLNAIGVGKTQDKEQFKIALEDVLKSNPNSDIKKQTEYMLNQLKSGINPGDISYINFSKKATNFEPKYDPKFNQNIKKKAATKKVKPQKKKQVQAPKPPTLNSEILAKIIPAIDDNKDLSANYIFNEDANHYFVLIIPTKQVNVNNLWTLIHYHDKRFKVTKDEYLKGQKMLVVKNFNNKENAAKYLKKIINNNNIYKHLSNVDYRHFIISKENFQLLKKSKALKAYIEFYKKKYITN